MLQVDLTAQIRKTFGKGAARRLRSSGETPAVLYGPSTDSLALVLDTKPFVKTLLSLRRQNAVINLEINDGKNSKKKHVMTRELQTDPITDSLVHADFYEISLDKDIILEVPVQYTGKAVGVDLGGDLNIAVTKITLKGKVLDIPDFVEVDITQLALDDRILCKDIDIPDNVLLESERDRVCVSVVARQVETLAVTTEE